MLFTSPAFLFGFLPIFLMAFILVSRSARLTLGARLVIILGTYLFYGFENVGYLIPFMFATCMDLIWGRLLESVQQERWRKLIVAASVVQNIGLLAIFKYLNSLYVN
ncbi:MAG: hypothetical protein EOP06_28115 [Proteobacteria bacterium]|nr:MAG: hypothetical protein EOP06_28115 [Pseudomonadota bacterium]